MIVEKIEGCNHMKHLNCSNPNDEEKHCTHFCYTCGEKLYGKVHKHEKDGTLHFPNDLFHDCRKANLINSQKNNQNKSNQLNDNNNCVVS